LPSARRQFLQQQTPFILEGRTTLQSQLEPLREPAHPVTQWLTAAEAAQHLRVETRTILSWARHGKVKAYALSGTKRHAWRFLRVDLDAMLYAPSVAADSRRIQ